jgi:hypothetical protein
MKSGDRVRVKATGLTGEIEEGLDSFLGDSTGTVTVLMDVDPIIKRMGYPEKQKFWFKPNELEII